MVCYSLRCLTRQIDQQTAQRSYLTRFGRRLRRQVMLVLRWSLQENILLDRLRLLEPSSPLLALPPQCRRFLRYHDLLSALRLSSSLFTMRRDLRPYQRSQVLRPLGCFAGTRSQIENPAGCAPPLLLSTGIPRSLRNRYRLTAARAADALLSPGPPPPTRAHPRPVACPVHHRSLALAARAAEAYILPLRDTRCR